LKASGSYYQVRAYNIRHGYNVNGFLEAYRRLLQKAVDEIWAGIRWIEKYDKKGRKRLIPVIQRTTASKTII
jgi:hypothetical protein